MITINIKADFDATIRRLKAQGKAVEQAQVSALNKAAAQSRTQMQRAITSTYNLSAGFVKERLSVRRAFKNGALAFSADLLGSDRKQSMNLIHFAASRLSGKEKAAWRKQTAKNGRLYGPQIPFIIKRGGGRVYVKGAFVGNDGRTVFMREGKSRLPIKAVQTIGVKGMFRSRKNTGEVQSWIQDNFTRIFERELKFYMSKYGK
jgi:hypothetical protein